MNTPLCIAIVQMPMKWTCKENTPTILEILVLAAEKGADICAFPELAITGFHREIKREADPDKINPALEEIQATCREYNIATAVGVPTFKGQQIFNSYLFINRDGNIIETTEKNGLTEAESTFFQPGTTRTVFEFEGRNLATVLCREIEDLDEVTHQIDNQGLDLILFPSLAGREPEYYQQSGSRCYEEEAAEMAKNLSTYVVQINWPHALNTPESRYLGKSVVISPEGKTLLKLPPNEAGLAIFQLGSAEYEWFSLG
ncbi:MAG: carbon-nitrogen hydrolase family protein [Endozoicomonas sp.]|uniref:carbon-nitrogen hydrolase family protein n=1 Tax=Endozoicomonas sp. TaxID=1892382 RepID=UPI003D9AFBC0